ncbi:YdcF family protein [Altererythrobacter sp.]|uniref:YdcF family protein n=1 Tax=Altererythrobacter sp. TaxID=1872480 RepID=UPI001B298B83|nr:YdcF family protein [Altererythrobacter sp.]MBO6609334.1 YdcF family protein [Altererythrobacter sp.]MBO6640665.1 YdcF family protein [Altererythrobacter sp.]MBO6708637.1 YdcF family protein [Altererythrobacter sp.]
MILRFVAGLFLIWVFGFVWFAASTPGPAGEVKTDAIVVATGEAGRIQRGIEILDRGLAQKMLVSGVNSDVTAEEFATEFSVSRRQMNCCVDLGFEATDTRSNATEILDWAKANKHKTLRLVTSDWHMRRAASELERLLPGSIVVVRDAVPTRFRVGTMLIEYNKLLASEFVALTGL